MFNRRQLYDLIWSEPLLTLSKKYNISDVGLRKMCVRLDIPLPEIGYWNKIKAGKKLNVRPFIEQKAGEQGIALLLRDQSGPEDEIGISPELALQRRIEADKSIDLTVASELSDADALILTLQKTFAKLPKDYREGDLLRGGSGELDIRVSLAQVDRALRLMNKFVQIMQQRGHGFEIKDGASYLMIWKNRYQLSLREDYTTVPDKDSWRRPTFVPTGIFTIQFEHWGKMTMKDGQKTIEQQLAKLIARIEIKAEEEKRWREENERQKTIREEKERQHRLALERKKTELDSFKAVIKAAQRWKITEMVRDYITEIEKEGLSESNQTPELATWLDWVKKKVDWFDPLVEAEDEWLSDVDQNSLLFAEEPKQTNSYARTTNNEHPPSEKKGWPLLPWYLKK